MYDDSDLDLYTYKEGCLIVGLWLENIGYALHEWDINMETSIVRPFESTYREDLQSRNIYGSSFEDIDHVFMFYNTLTNVHIQIIQVRQSIAECVLHFHSSKITLLMSFDLIVI